MKSAVIKTGGKQYFVKEGDKVKVEKLPVAAGKKTSFPEVLLTNTDKITKVGTPLVKGAVVEAKVLKHGRHAKVTGVKMKAKKRYRRLFGHKQHYTEIEIIKIKSKV